jgi:hypothetical protein
VKHGWLSGFSLAQVAATPAAAADAVPTHWQTVGPGPCGPVAAGCYGASAAELELEGVPLVLSGCRPLTGTVTRTLTAARPVPLTGSLSGSRLRPSQMLKRNFKLNLKYDMYLHVSAGILVMSVSSCQ